MTSEQLKALAQAAERHLIKHFTGIILGYAAGLVAIPVVGWLFSAAVKWGVGVLVREGKLTAFYINTQGIVSEQGQQYVRDALAVYEVDPENTLEWERREDAANKSFARFISLGQ